MKTTTIAALTLLSLTLGTPQASAKSDFIKTNVTRMVKRIGVHGNVSFRNPTDPDVTKGRTFGGSVGLAPGQHNGWRFPYAISFFSEYLHGDNGTQFATLKARSLLGGVGYGWHFGKLSTGASLQAGFVNYRIHEAGDPLRAFNLASGTVAMDAHNSWLLRPQLKAEYFITPKFTLRVSGDYVFSRPDIVVTTPAGRVDNRWDASNYHANIGVGIYPFHK